jgi:hypothetical protein
MTFTPLSLPMMTFFSAISLSTNYCHIENSHHPSNPEYSVASFRVRTMLYTWTFVSVQDELMMCS